MRAKQQQGQDSTGRKEGDGKEKRDISAEKRREAQREEKVYVDGANDEGGKKGEGGREK